MPREKNSFARLWYGWNDFAQGGINEEGLFFDGATTPKQDLPVGYSEPKGNLGDDLLAKCHDVKAVISYLEERRIAINEGHILIGDKSGNAVVIEWLHGTKKLINIKDNRLMVTNFLLSDTTSGNYPCYRYSAMEKAINDLQVKDSITLKDVGNVIAKAVQVKSKSESGREGGTLYSTFINISDMSFVSIYKLDNTKMIKLDLQKEFAIKKERKIFFN